MFQFLKTIYHKNPSLVSVIGLMGIGFLAIIFFIFRNTGLFPMVSDERVYSQMVRLASMSVSGIPSYLYILIYRVTNMCGSGFLDCARFLNSLFLIFSLPFIYLIARRVCSQWLALVVSFLSVFAPFNVYTAFYQPESLYFFGFWVLAYLTLRLRSLPPLIYGLIWGGSLGLLALIKVHAIFLLPGFFLFILLTNYPKSWKKHCLNFLITIIGTGVSFIVFRFGLGYLFAGQQSFSLFGNIYDYVGKTGLTNHSWGEMLSLAKYNLWGHLMGLSVLFGLPISLLLGTKIKMPENLTEPHKKLFQLRIFIFSFLLSLLLMVIAFTALNANRDPSETAARLYFRYYNFFFPLFWIYVAAMLSKSREAVISKYLWLATLPPLAFIIYAMITKFSGFTAYFVDSPELFSLIINNIWLNIFCLLSIICLILFLKNRHWSTVLYLFVFIPLLLIYPGYQITVELNKHHIPKVYEQASTFAKYYLNPDDLKYLAIAGSDVPQLYLALMNFDQFDSNFLVLNNNDPLQLDQIKDGTKWVLVIGDHPLPERVNQVVSRPGFSLININNSEEINFSDTIPSSLLKDTQGLSFAEKWGAWSDGSKINLTFYQPLPNNFQLAITAWTLSQNNKTLFNCQIGNQRRTFKLSEEPQEVLLDFTTSGSEKNIVINIPKTISPKDIGLSSDNRQLGIGLIKIRIIDKIKEQK